MSLKKPIQIKEATQEQKIQGVAMAKKYFEDGEKDFAAIRDNIITTTKMPTSDAVNIVSWAQEHFPPIADPMPKVPAFLKSLPHWLRWKLETDKSGRPTKVPYQVNGYHASSTDPATWTDYKTAVNGAVIDSTQGVGFALNGDGITGFDLDGCRNAETDEFTDWANEIIDNLDESYTEVTPSGLGARVWVRGKLPAGDRVFHLDPAVGFGEKVQVEVFEQGKYFTITGDAVFEEATDVKTCDLAKAYELLHELRKKYPAPKKEKTTTDTSGSDESVPIQKIGDGETNKYNIFMTGTIESQSPFRISDKDGWVEYPSQSEADMALATVLAIKYDCDREKIDTDFRASKLMREKWERDDYRENTITRAVKSAEKIKAETITLVVNQKPALQPVPQPAAQPDLSQWRNLFRSVGEMEQGPIVMVITGVIQEGTCFIGASPGDGKTLLALAIAKAICTGEPLFGLPQFSVPVPRTVIYLIPESRDRAFRIRCESFRLPNDKMKFMARTISSGAPLSLADPYLLEAVRQTKAVVFLDTAIRFMRNSSDENAATQNKQLVDDVIALLATGAASVVLMHHATKASANEPMTQENMLRGTSDFAAMCDQIYGIRKDRALYASGGGPLEIDVANLKDREQIGELHTLRLAASYKRAGDTFTTSYIDETGNFQVVSDTETAGRLLSNLIRTVEMNPNIAAKDLADQFSMKKFTVENKLARAGWHRVQGGSGGASPWHKDVGLECPYKKPEKLKGVKLDTPKPPKPTVEDAVRLLKSLLSNPAKKPKESDVFTAADKQGLSDGLINKAKKRLDVRVAKDKTWGLPPASDLIKGQPEGQEAEDALVAITGAEGGGK